MTILSDIVEAVTSSMRDLIVPMIAYIPYLIAAIIILIIGWIIGRFLGGIISKILDKAGVDDALRKTSIGKAIEQSGTNIVHLFDLIVRWFIYLIAIAAAASVLKIGFISDLFEDFILYLPHIAMFLIILIAGFILIDYLLDLIQAWGKTQDIEFLGVILVALRIFFYFVIVILALSQLLIDLTIIYTFVTPIAWGVGIGIGVGIAVILAFGLKDRAPEMVSNLLNKIHK
jgi:small-conductance mechanosensitive channel